MICFHIELHTKEGKYFVKCYKSEKPDINQTFYQLWPYNIQEKFDYDLKQWKESEVIYQVHESQVEGFYKYARFLSKPVYLFPKDEAERIDKLLEQGVTLPASKVEIRKIESRPIISMSPTGLKNHATSEYFAFLVEEVKEETNEAELWDEFMNDWSEASMDDYAGKDVIGYLKLKYHPPIKRK